MLKAMHDGSFVGICCIAHLILYILWSEMPWASQAAILEVIDVGRKIPDHVH